MYKYEYLLKILTNFKFPKLFVFELGTTKKIYCKNQFCVKMYVFPNILKNI